MKKTSKNVSKHSPEVIEIHGLIKSLKLFRKSKKIKQTIVAERMVVDKSVVSKFERLKQDIHFSTLIKYIRAIEGELTLSMYSLSETKTFTFPKKQQ